MTLTNDQRSIDPQNETAEPLVVPTTRRGGNGLRRYFSVERSTFLVLIAVLAILIVYPSLQLVFSALTVEGQFSVTGFIQTWTSSEVLVALRNSALYTVASVIIAIVCGVILAWFLKRTNVPGGELLNRLPILPMLFPPILGTLGWVMLLAPGSGLLNNWFLDDLGLGVDVYTMGGAIWVESMYLIPWVHMLVASGFDSFDGNLADASRSSGGSALATFFTIELPLLRPHILAATLLTAVLALSSYTVPVMLASVGGDNVLAVLIAQYGMNFVSPAYAAGSISILILAVTLLGTYGQKALTRGNRFVMVGGKGFGVSKVNLGPWRWVAFGGVCLYFVVTIVLPVLSLFYVSLLPRWDTNLSLSEVSFQNYIDLFTSSNRLWDGYFTSLLLAVVSATVIMVLATIAAILGARARFRGIKWLDYLAMTSVGVPAVAFGFGVLEAYIQPPLVLYGTIWAIIVGYIGGFFGFGFQQVQAAVKQLDSSLEEAARVSGSGLYGAIFRVVFPLIRTGFVAGWLLVFIITFREHPMSALLIGSDTTVVSTSMFSYYELGQYTAVSAFAIIVFITTFVISLLVSRKRSVG